MSDSNSWFSLVVKTGKKVNVLIVQLFLPIFCNPRRWWCNSSFQSFSLQGGGATLRWDFIRRKPFYHRPAQIGQNNLDKPAHLMLWLNQICYRDLIWFVICVKQRYVERPAQIGHSNPYFFSSQCKVSLKKKISSVL